MNKPDATFEPVGDSKTCHPKRDHSMAMRVFDLCRPIEPTTKCALDLEANMSLEGPIHKIREPTVGLAKQKPAFPAS